MKSASNRSNYRFNPCKRRRPSFSENNNNSSTSTHLNYLSSAGNFTPDVCKDLANATRRSSLKRTNSLDTDSSSAINAPLSFDSTLKVCIDKIRTDLIFNVPEVTSINNVTRLVTDDDTVGQIDDDTVTPSCTDENIEQEDNSHLLYDTIPHSTPAQKEARRAKRRLQLEQWRQYGLNRARNERYHNRLKRRHGISFANPSSQQKTIKWKKNLVQIFLIDCDTCA